MRRLPGDWNANTHGAKPVRETSSMSNWSQTSRLSIKDSLSLGCAADLERRPVGIGSLVLARFRADDLVNFHVRHLKSIFGEGISVQGVGWFGI